MTESECLIRRAIEDNWIKYERAKWEGDRKRAALLLWHARRWMRDTGIDPRK